MWLSYFTDRRRSFCIYRNNLKTLIGEVFSDKKLRFEDHNGLKNVIYTYYIVSVDAQNVSSLPEKIIIRP